MDCHLFTLLIQKYYDGELERAVEAEFETHLAECKECRAIGDSYYEAFSALEGMGVYQPLPEFNDRVMAHVNVRKYRKSLFAEILGTLYRRWNLLPGFIRIGGAVTGVFAMFMYIFRPVFLYLLSKGGSLLTFVASAAAFLKESRAGLDIIVNYFKSDPEFILAATILFQKLKGMTVEIPIGYFVSAFVLICLVVLMVAGVSRSSWRKGDSHVGFI